MSTYYHEIRRAAEEWFQKASEYPYALYLYYIPAGERLSVFRDEVTPGEEYRLVTGERMPVNTDISGICRWIEERTRSIPFFRP